MKGLFSVISCWRANLQLQSYNIKSALPKCWVRLLLRHFGVLVMTNHQASSYTVPPEIAVLFSYHSTVKLILRKLMSVHWFEMDLQSVNSSFQESTITTTSTQWPKLALISLIVSLFARMGKQNVIQYHRDTTIALIFRHSGKMIWNVENVNGSPGYWAYLRNSESICRNGHAYIGRMRDSYFWGT